MAERRNARCILASVLGIVCAAQMLHGQSHWVSMGPGGKLVYATTAKGDRIPDFSYAGYEAGGVALPQVPAKRTVAPSGGDDSAAIQKAIDEVSALPLARMAPQSR